MIDAAYRPKIPKYFVVIKSSEEKIQFRSPNRNILLRGKSVKMLNSLLPHLTGNMNISQLSRRAKISEVNLKNLLNILEKRGIVFDCGRKGKEKYARYKEAEKFFSRQIGDINAIIPIKKLQQSSIILIGIGTIGFRVLMNLIDSGIRKLIIIDDEKIKQMDTELGNYSNQDVGKLRIEVAKKIIKENKNIKFKTIGINEISASELGVSDLVVFCSDTFSPHEHNMINELCLKNNKMWIGSRFFNDIGEVGPTVIPFKTSCFRCYDLRIMSNVDDVKEYLDFKQYLKHKKESYGALKPFFDIIAGYVTLEIIKILTRFQEPLTLNAVLSIDFKSCNNNINQVLKVPDCPACGREI